MTRLLQLLCVFSSITSAFAGTTNLTFEGAVFPDGYAGLIWGSLRTINTTTAVDGFRNAAVSPVTVAADIDGRFGQVTGLAAFDLVSGYFTSAYRDGLNLEVQGFAGSILVYDSSFTLNTAGPTLVTLNYAGITEVKFLPTGGTLHPGFTDAGIDDTDFAMDNLTLSLPERGLTMDLLGMASIGLALARKQFKSRRSV